MKCNLRINVVDAYDQLDGQPLAFDVVEADTPPGFRYTAFDLKGQHGYSYATLDRGTGNGQLYYKNGNGRVENVPCVLEITDLAKAS